MDDENYSFTLVACYNKCYLLLVSLAGLYNFMDVCADYISVYSNCRSGCIQFKMKIIKYIYYLSGGVFTRYIYAQRVNVVVADRKMSMCAPRSQDLLPLSTTQSPETESGCANLTLIYVSVALAPVMVMELMF